MLVRGPFTVEKAERVCQWYYRVGFLGLPWLWGLLWLLFRHYEQESEPIRWYVARVRQYSLAGAAAFITASLVLLFALPPSSPLWVIAPFQDTFQWGFFAANASEQGNSGANSSSGDSSSFA